MIMKIPVKEIVEKEASAIRCVVCVRHEEDDIPNNYPGRIGETWSVVIDIETGQIRDWPTGVPSRELHMKVCDGGSYYLLAPNGSVLAALEQEYVPRCLPQEYGDYIRFQIDEGGKITNWEATPDSVQRAFFFRYSDE